MSLYATVEEIRSLGIQTDALDSTVWDVIAEAASRQIDTLCEVDEDFFAAADYTDDDPPEPIFEDRHFYGNGTKFLTIEHFVSLDADDPVTVDGTTAAPEYLLKDRTLILKTDSSIRVWPLDGVITVKAHWGFPQVPADIKLATMKLALISWRMGDPTNAERAEANSEPLIDGVPASVWAIVDKYRARYTRAHAFV